METTRVGDLVIDGAEPGALYVLRSRINDRCYGSIDVLHVISKPAGGEIRGYKRPVDAPGPWTVRLPNYTGDWPEMDAAVAAVVGEQVENSPPPPVRFKQLGLLSNTGTDFLDRIGRALKGPALVVFAVAALATGACNATAPAPAPETVGTLAPSYGSVTSAPVARTTDLSVGFQAIDSDDGPAVSGAGEVGTAAPEVAAKGGGLVTGAVR